MSSSAKRKLEVKFTDEPAAKRARTQPHRSCRDGSRPLWWTPEGIVPLDEIEVIGCNMQWSVSPFTLEERILTGMRLAYLVGQLRTGSNAAKSKADTGYKLPPGPAQPLPPLGGGESKLPSSPPPPPLESFSAQSNSQFDIPPVPPPLQPPSAPLVFTAIPLPATAMRPCGVMFCRNMATVSWPNIGGSRVDICSACDEPSGHRTRVEQTYCQGKQWCWFCDCPCDDDECMCPKYR